MNSLSWLIYASDVIPRIGWTSGFFAFLLGSFLAGYTILFIVYNADQDEEAKRYNKEPRYLKFYWKSGLFALLFLSFIANITPSQQTILLVAGSEMGEKVIETEVGQQAIRILKNKLSEIELEQTHNKRQ